MYVYVYLRLLLLPFCISSVTYSLYKLLTEGTLVVSTTQFVNGEEQLQSDTTQHIINEVISRSSSRSV